METGKRLRPNTPMVISEIVEDEVVLVNFDSGSYYSLAGSGTEVWRALESGELNLLYVAPERFRSRAFVERKPRPRGEGGARRGDGRVDLVGRRLAPAPTHLARRGIRRREFRPRPVEPSTADQVAHAPPPFVADFGVT